MTAVDLRDVDPLLTELQAALRLNISTRTLQSWRRRGFGPAFIRVGRSIRYSQAALIEWMSKNTFPGK
jgi:hypothetical protein